MATTTRRSQRFGRTLTPWGFPIVYLGWAFLFWLPIVGSDSSVWSYPNVVLFLVGGSSPLLAAVLMAALTGGRERVRDLGHRLIDVRRIEPRWWVIVLCYWPAFNLLMAGLALLLGVSAQPIDVVWDVLFDPGTLAFMLALSLLFPAVEEVGLRGYYLDQLQERFSPTVAGLLNGGTWAVWHAPFVLLPGYYANTTFDPALWWWLPSIVVQTLLLVWVYNNTRRSILAVLLFHASMNLSGEFLGLAPEMFPFLLVGNVLAAGLLVAYWRRTGATAPIPRI